MSKKTSRESEVLDELEKSWNDSKSNVRNLFGIESKRKPLKKSDAENASDTEEQDAEKKHATYQRKDAEYAEDHEGSDDEDDEDEDEDEDDEDEKKKEHEGSDDEDDEDEDEDDEDYEDSEEDEEEDEAGKKRKAAEKAEKSKSKTRFDREMSKSVEAQAAIDMEPFLRHFVKSINKAFRDSDKRMERFEKQNKALASSVLAMGELTKSVRSQVKDIGDSPMARKGVLAKSIKESAGMKLLKLSPQQILSKAMKFCQEGRLSPLDVTKIEGRLNKGLELDPAYIDILKEEK